MKHQLITRYFEYFEHIKDKTFIDKYPSTIIRLGELKDTVFVELGSGHGNDVKYLIEDLGLNPANLYLTESDIYYFVDAFDKLEELFGRHYNERHFFPRDFLEVSLFFSNNFADFIYANNFLHCLGHKTIYDNINLALHREKLQDRQVKLKPKDKIKLIFSEVYRILKPRGVFFGRTLSRSLDNERLRGLEAKIKKSEKEEFALKTAKKLKLGQLAGLSELELKMFARDVGFSKSYIEIKEAEEWVPFRDFYFRFEK